MTASLALLGGQPIRTRPLGRRHPFGQAERDAALRVLDSGSLSGFLGSPGPFFNGGTEVRRFEAHCEAHFGYRHAVTVNSWTSGLMVCLGACGIGPGDEVICPPYTMSASAVSALFYGGVPVFADIDPLTCCLDPQSVRAKITERTRAIVVVHLFGYPANLTEIAAIAREFNLRVVEDAAQAPGTWHRGERVGGLVDIGGYSLNFHKHIQTGEGGIIVTNDDDLAERARLIRNHGENALESFPGENLQNLFGGNFRLTEISAAIGDAQLDRLDGILTAREERASILREGLQGLPGLTIPPLNEGERHSYYTFPLIYDEAVSGLPRADFLRAVQAEFPPAEGWDTSVIGGGYVAPLYWGRLFRERLGMGRANHPFSLAPQVTYERGDCPVCEELYRSTLVGTDLTREWAGVDEAQDLVRAVEKVLENAHHLATGPSAGDTR
jgi:perosamine synthetase